MKKLQAALLFLGAWVFVAAILMGASELIKLFGSKPPPGSFLWPIGLLVLGWVGLYRLNRRLTPRIETTRGYHQQYGALVEKLPQDDTVHPDD